jgi:hypothetical protein
MLDWSNLLGRLKKMGPTKKGKTRNKANGAATTLKESK